MPRTPAAALLIPAFLLTACPDKGAEVAPPTQETSPAPDETQPAGQALSTEGPAPRSVLEAKESVCDCTCEGEGCRCTPLTWRVGCICHDEEMQDCACDCKGETIVSVEEVTTEAVMKTDPDLRIEERTNEEIAEEVPPPPPPPPDAS
jgi:hypothetical protein